MRMRVSCHCQKLGRTRRLMPASISNRVSESSLFRSLVSRTLRDLRRHMSGCAYDKL